MIKNSSILNAKISIWPHLLSEIRALGIARMYPAVIICFLAINIVSPAYSSTASLCPGISADPVHKKTMDYYSYRLTPQIKKFGCDVVEVYTAFGNDNGTLLERAEEDDDLMKSLIRTMQRVPGLSKSLHNTPRLTQALDSALQDDAALDSILSTLQMLNENAIKELSADRPELATLTIILPGISPNFLSRQFTQQQLRLLIKLLEQSAIVSELAQLEGMEQLLPVMTSNPKDALNIYKNVLATWGTRDFTRMAAETPYVISATVPPLTLAQLENLNPLSSQPAAFREMQQEYIHLIHDLYQSIAKEHGAAWAAEYCMAFADLLPLALLGADKTTADNIRHLFMDLLHSEFFTRILQPSACFEETNLALLGGLLIERTTPDLNNFGARTHGLAALAQWHASGKLMPLLLKWLPYTNANKFSVQLKANGEAENSEENVDDSIFWAMLVQLAVARTELHPEQQAILDELCLELIHPNVHPAATLNFLYGIHEPLFDIIKPGKFNQPYEVALRLLTIGYPDSDSDSLYTAALKGDPLGQMPAAGRAIENRGRRPEAEILRHGQTFADRHGGWSAMDMVETADTIITVGGAAAFTIMTAGTGSPVLAGAISRIGLKQAARMASKLASKAIARGIRATPRLLRPVVRGTVKLVRHVATSGMPETGAKTTMGKVWQTGANIWKYGNTAYDIYELIRPDQANEKTFHYEAVEICPEKAVRE